MAIITDQKVVDRIWIDWSRALPKERYSNMIILWDEFLQEHGISQRFDENRTYLYSDNEEAMLAFILRYS